MSSCIGLAVYNFIVLCAVCKLWGRAVMLQGGPWQTSANHDCRCLKQEFVFCSWRPCPVQVCTWSMPRVRFSLSWSLLQLQPWWWVWRAKATSMVNMLWWTDCRHLCPAMFYSLWLFLICRCSAEFICSQSCSQQCPGHGGLNQTLPPSACSSPHSCSSGRWFIPTFHPIMQSEHG